MRKVTPGSHSNPLLGKEHQRIPPDLLQAENRLSRNSMAPPLPPHCQSPSGLTSRGCIARWDPLPGPVAAPIFPHPLGPRGPCCHPPAPSQRGLVLPCLQLLGHR